jgi:hypothetical protein
MAIVTWRCIEAFLPIGQRMIGASVAARRRKSPIAAAHAAGAVRAPSAEVYAGNYAQG